MAARFAVYRFFPMTGADAWFWRDAFMSFPRLAAFAACLLLTRRTGGFARRGWRWDARATPCALLALLIFFFAIRYVGQRRVTTFASWQIAVGWLTTLPVAFFEEAAFRGLLFTSIRGRMGPMRAALVSTTLFVFYHVQAMSLVHGWPLFVIFGLAACAALERGAGLPWLIATHEVVDSIWFHLGRGIEISRPALYVPGYAGMVACAIAALALLI